MIIFAAQNTKKVDFFFISPRNIIFRKKWLGSMLTPRNPKQVSPCFYQTMSLGRMSNTIWQMISVRGGPLFKKGLTFLGVIMSRIQPEHQILMWFPFSNNHQMTECVHKAVKTCHPLSPKHTVCDVSQLSHDCLRWTQHDQKSWRIYVISKQSK